MAVLTQAMLITLFSLFDRTIAATAPRAVMAVVSAGEKYVEFSVAELAIRLILHWLTVLA